MRGTLPERLLTVVQVADVLGVCRATIYKLCERGELAHVRVSNAIRFERHHLGAFLVRQRSGAHCPPRRPELGEPPAAEPLEGRSLAPLDSGAQRFGRGTLSRPYYVIMM